ncbi:hypothetical protein G1H11_11270 [Phytoactinopolyspora alkaliphila]|uniref:Uncharacterized protein n=1 Tax=Phytoactinopolyspora alkaliphila TaxID=1783498 RepID=A0A6N9YLE1_9ACTN|nr:hypothetical protein [Phytoactinopolyspora alkaliphila]NED95891.1 hypothetical protein [Phytoactinopolyspora alkaliphila]
MSAQVAIVCDRCGDIGGVGAAAQELRASLTGWSWRNGLDTCPLCRLVTHRGEERSGTQL